LTLANGAGFRFYYILVWYFVYAWGVYLGFTAQRQQTPLNL